MARTLQHNHIWARGPLVVQTLFILVAPVFFTASIYIVFGRIVQLVDGGRYSLVQTKWLVKIFVSADALSFLIQAIGKAFDGRPHYKLTFITRCRHLHRALLSLAAHRSAHRHCRSPAPPNQLHHLPPHCRHIPLPPRHRQANSQTATLFRLYQASVDHNAVHASQQTAVQSTHVQHLLCELAHTHQGLGQGCRVLPRQLGRSAKA